MQPIKHLCNWLQQHASSEHYLFSLQDLRALFPCLAWPAFKTLLCRAVQAKYLEKVCRDLYIHKNAAPTDGLLLFHAAAHLRSHAFNYISLETVLSDVGIISQVPMQWITIMSSGRSSIISCGTWGTIEFIHTNQSPSPLIDHLSYDKDRRLWRANVRLALKDMKKTRRDSNLINWKIAHELI